MRLSNPKLLPLGYSTLEKCPQGCANGRDVALGCPIMLRHDACWCGFLHKRGLFNRMGRPSFLFAILSNLNGRDNSVNVLDGRQMEKFASKIINYINNKNKCPIRRKTYNFFKKTNGLKIQVNRTAQQVKIFFFLSQKMFWRLIGILTCQVAMAQSSLQI